MRDPNLNFHDYESREMLFPKRWVTIGVIDAEARVRVN